MGQWKCSYELGLRQQLVRVRVRGCGQPGLHQHPKSPILGLQKFFSKKVANFFWQKYPNYGKKIQFFQPSQKKLPIPKLIKSMQMQIFKSNAKQVFVRLATPT